MSGEWDTTLPANSLAVASIPQTFKDTKTNIIAVFEKEHETLGDSNTGGEHSSGSAVSYEGTTSPTNRPDASTALADNAIDRGRIWIDGNFDPPVVKRWSGTAWIVLGRCIVDSESVVLSTYNQKHEDIAGGRETQIRAHGEQSGGEASTLGFIEISHDSTGDDQKGKIRLVVNDGDDSDAPSKVGIVVNSDGTVTCAQVVTVADGSTNASSAAPTANAQLANKKYVDDQVTASYVCLSAYTNQDSESNTMLKSHAYKAATDGFVSADNAVAAADDNKYLDAYVGLTNDPAGAGALICRQGVPNTDSTAHVGTGSIAVAKNEYFEITSTYTAAPTIRWKSFGTLSKPVDQD